MKKFIFILLVSTCLIKCNSDDLDCSTVLCEGRPTLILEIIDQESEIQYFTDVTNTAPDGLTITRNDFGESLEFGQGYAITEGRLFIFQFPDEVTITLENEFDVNISSNVIEMSNGGCCLTYFVENTSTSNGILEITDTANFEFKLTI